MILAVENVSLSFGGVKALQEVSFDVKEHEIRDMTTYSVDTPKLENAA